MSGRDIAADVVIDVKKGELSKRRLPETLSPESKYHGSKKLL